ncbi:hypothetical protein Tco_0466416 [Tanacetum coccineum]
MQKTILKQQYKNFTTSRSEGLDKTFERFQKLICQLKIHGEVISQEEANLKLLRSLPLAWNNIALIMRNKSNIDTMSMDDLYNNLKVYEVEIKSQSSLSLNSYNVAFGQASSSSYADDVMFSFFVAMLHESEEIIKEDRKKSELQWQRNCWCIRCIKFRLDGILAPKLGINLRVLKEHFDKQKEQLKKSNLEIIGYQLGLESLEARIVVHQKNEAVYEKDIAFLKYDVKVRDNSISELKNQLAEALREKDDLKLKLENDSVYKTNVSKTITSVPRNESTASKSSKDNLEQPKDVRPSVPIVEEWKSDSDDNYVTRPSIEHNKPSFAKINFVKSNENTRKSVIEQNTMAS